jgi:hypothetical protein
MDLILRYNAKLKKQKELEQMHERWRLESAQEEAKEFEESGVKKNK